VKWAGAMREKRIDAGTLIKEVRKLRARVAELERVGADRGGFEAGDRELDKAWRQWERTFDAIEDPIFLLDGESRILEANLAVSRFFDVPLEEILGSPCWKVVHGLDERPEDCPAARALQTGKREKAEIYLPHKDLYLSISVDPVFDKQGEVTTIVHTIRNVTESKRAEEALRESEERFRLLATRTPVGIFLASRKGRVMFVNEAVCKLTGLSKREHYDSGWLKAVHPEDRRRVEDEWHQTIEGESNFAIEFRFVCGSGRISWVSASTVALRDDRGEVAGFLGALTDITARKDAEEALLLEKRILEDMARCVGCGLMVVDADRRVTYANRLAEEWFGPLDEIVGKSCCEVLGTESGKCPTCRMLRTGQKAAGEISTAGVDGQERFFQVVASPVREPDGRICRGVQLVIDITERKQAEAERRLNESRLEALVRLDQMVGASLEDVGDFALSEATRLTGSTVGFIGFLDETESVLTVVTWSSEVLARCAIANKPLEWRVKDGGLWAEAIRQRRPVVVNDYAADDRRKKGYPSGHIALSRFMSVPIFDKGRIVAIVGVGNKHQEYSEADVRQVTLLGDGVWKLARRMEADQKLRASEGKYRFLFDAVPTAIVISDFDGNILDCNRAGEQLLGYSPDELRSTNIGDYYLGPDRPSKLLGMLRKSGRISNRELRFRRKNGSVLHTLTNIDVVERDGRKVLLGTSRDITYRKKAVDALRASEEKFRVIAEQSFDAILATDEAGTLTYASPSVSRVFGYGPDEMVGKKLADFVLGSDAPGFGERFAEVAGGKGVEGEEIRVVRKDGSIGTIELNWGPTRKAGRVVGTHASARDISVRKEAERKLVEFRSVLACELAAAEERERKEIATGLHDEVIQPLVFLDIKLKSLMNDGVDERLSGELGRIRQIISDLIGKARTLTFDLSYPVLYELGLEAAIERWLTAYLREEHGLETEFVDDHSAKPLDEKVQVFLFKALKELFTNIVKHAEAKKVRVSIAREGERVVLCVADDGVGFGFEVTDLKQSRYSGFGLFSIRERVEYLGGSVRIESGPGRGTQVWLTVPVRGEGEKS